MDAAEAAVVDCSSADSAMQQVEQLPHLTLGGHLKILANLQAVGEVLTTRQAAGWRGLQCQQSLARLDNYTEVPA